MNFFIIFLLSHDGVHIFLRFFNQLSVFSFFNADSSLFY